ncbi:MAG TPA: ABC transporter substrate-binding protein [Dehalococcoidia bacterium]|nr:ABC transporter substrate-binding protein [Dehalococcoidia bacterium]
MLFGQRPIRLFTVLFLTVAVLALLAVACGDDEEAAPRTGTPTGPRQVISFDMPWAQYGLISSSIPHAVALEKGFFEQEGLKPNFVPTRGGGDTLQALLSTNAPMAIISPGIAISAIEQGQKLKLVWQSNRGGVVEGQGFTFCVKNSSPIRSPKDLKGKSIAFTRPGANSELFAKHMVREAGLDPDKDVRLVAAGGLPEGLTLMDQGAVDVATCAPEILAALKRSAGEWRNIWEAQDDFPGFVEVWLAVKEDALTRNPELVKSYLRAIRNAVDWMDKNKDSEELVQLSAKLLRIPPEQIDALRARLKEYASAGFKKVFPIEFLDDALRSSVQVAVLTGELKEVPQDLSRYIDKRQIP